MEEVVRQDRKQVLLAEARRRRIAWINADEPSECEVIASVNAAGKDVAPAKKRANVTALFKDATGLETLLPLARDYVAHLNQLAGEVEKEVVEYMPQPTVVDESQTGDEAEYPRYEYGIPHYEIFMRKLRHPAAAELVKAMQRFVQQFIERQSTVKETGQHVSHPGGSSADSVHLFLQTMETEMHKNVLWSEESGPQWEETKECLEKFIMTKLRRHLFTAPEAVELSKRDQALSERLSALAFVGPEHLDLKSLQRDTVDALKPAVWEMRGLIELKSPKDMIDCLLNVAKHITRQLVHAREGGSFGADDFLPAMILVVKEANPSKLHSALEVIQRYRHPSRLVSEAGYIFAHVVSAVHFLETADASQLSISQEALEAHLQRVTCTAADGEQSTLANMSDEKAMDTSSSTRNSRANTSLNIPSTSSEVEAQPPCFEPRSIQDVRRERAVYRQEIQETTAPPWLELLADTRLSYFGTLAGLNLCRG